MRIQKPGGKLIVLDANPDFVTEKDNFGRAFFDLHAQVIEYRTNVVIDQSTPPVAPSSPMPVRCAATSST